MITPCVTIRPARAMAPHLRETLDRLLDRHGAHRFADGRALIECGQDAAAKQIAALVRHLGANAHAIYIGGS